MTSIRAAIIIIGLATASPIAAAPDPLAPLPAPLPPTPPAPQLPSLAPYPQPLPATAMFEPTSSSPRELTQRVSQLVRGFDGSAGAAVLSLRGGWRIDVNGGRLFPQQSCSKLWVSLAMMDAVDQGRVRLDDPVTLDRSDLTLFNQPIAAKIFGGGGHTTTVGALMFDAITSSDNTANDKLMRTIGGPPAVRAMIAAKGLGAIRFYDGERALQSRIAGLVWSPAYSIGNAFTKARNALPLGLRRSSFEHYVSNPYDGAAPIAVATALARLKRGELLSPQSTAHLLAVMGATRTGKYRVKAALKPGWQWNHKTGTGQDFKGRIGGLNDIGLLTAPDGSVYAMAIMTIPNHKDGRAQDIMQAIARAVIAAHEARGAGR